MFRILKEWAAELQEFWFLTAAAIIVPAVMGYVFLGPVGLLSGVLLVVAFYFLRELVCFLATYVAAILCHWLSWVLTIAPAVVLSLLALMHQTSPTYWLAVELYLVLNAVYMLPFIVPTTMARCYWYTYDRYARKALLKKWGYSSNGADAFAESWTRQFHHV